MKKYGTYFKVWIYGILFISATLPALLAVKNIKISPDSMIYALISQEIISGNGIRLPIIRLQDTYTIINGTIPYLEQPPLLPIIFAISGGITSQNFLAAQILNLISHVLIAIFSFLLMKKIYNNNGIALLTGTLISISFPLLRVTHYLWSETLFIALSTGAVYFLTLSRYSGRHQFSRNLFIAGICAGAAILTRFAGVALIPMFFWEVYVLVKNKSIKSKYTPAILAAILPVITTGALFIRNYMVSGTITGWSSPSPERSYLSAFTGTINMIFLQFHLGERSVILITIFAILFILYIITNTASRRELSKCLHSGMDLIIIFIVAYTMVISLAMAKSQTVFELRYMSPLVPFLFIISIFAIVFIWDSLKSRGFSRLSLYGMILSLSIIAVGSCYKTFLTLPGFFKQDQLYSIEGSCTYNWVTKNYGKDIIMATNKPYQLSFFGGYSTIQLPHKKFNKNIRVPEDMESILPGRMLKFGARLLVLFGEAREQHYGGYIEGLFNIRENDDNFTVAHECPDGVVYRIKE